MVISARGINDIKQEEGFSSVTYVLNNVPHIGYGFNKNYHSLPDVITRDAADAYLIQILPSYEYHVRNVNAPLTQRQYDVLTSYVYNKGHIPNALKSLLSAGNYTGAAAWIESDYTARGLSARGKRAAKMFLSDSFKWWPWVVGVALVVGSFVYFKKARK